MRLPLSLLALTLIAGCTSPSIDLNPEAKFIHVRTDKGFRVENCTWKGEVTGSEGHWYTYLFLENDTMIRGALNDMKNSAHELGANTVFLLSPHYFVTSVTLVGTAYHCDYDTSPRVNIEIEHEAPIDDANTND